MNVGTVLLLLAVVQGIRAGCERNSGSQLVMQDGKKRLIKFYGFTLKNGADSSVTSPPMLATVNGKLCANVTTPTKGDQYYTCKQALIGKQMIVKNAKAGGVMVYCTGAQAAGMIWCGSSAAYDSKTDSCVKCPYGANGNGQCNPKPSGPPPPKIPKGPRVNVALKKRTWQSREAWWGASGRANDGNRNPKYGGNSCSHTVDIVRPFWAVDLGQKYTVTGVSVTNRVDWPWAYVLRNFIVVVTDNKPHASLAYSTKEICTYKQEPFFKGQVIWDSKCYQPISGQYVMVQMKHKAALVMCEVDVWNVQLPDTWPSGDMISAALGKHSWQSSEAWWGAPGRANDGNTATAYGHHSCMHTKPHDRRPYWAVDLGSSVIVTGVTVVNRVDWLHDKVLKEINVVVTDIRPSSKYQYKGSQVCAYKAGHFVTSHWTVRCYKPLKGEFVMVHKLNIKEPLVFCEINVYTQKLPSKWPVGDRITTH